jgi:hypothetical protein
MSSPRWIPLFIHARDPKVMRIASLTGEHVCTVTGRAVEWFRWIDEHCLGPKTGISANELESIVGFVNVALPPRKSTYADAFADVKWITLDDQSDDVIVVNFKKHFGKSAKRRHLDARRKRRQRVPRTADKRPQASGQKSTNDGQKSQNSGPRKEKKREEKRREENTPAHTRSDPVKSSSKNTGVARAVPPASDFSGKDSTGPDRLESLSGERFVQVFAVELMTALGLNGQQVETNRKPFKAIGAAVAKHQDCVETAGEMIAIAHEIKEAPQISNKAAAWTARVKRRWRWAVNSKPKE